MKTKQKELLITIFIVLIAFLIRVIRLDIPRDWSFDEVYHALSAEAYALNDPRGYEWWNPSPKDLAWEWLHPPLAKLFMAASIKIFAKPYIPESKQQPLDGATTFAWRFPGTIFAALTVWLLIIFGTNLFKNFWIGVVAGGLYGLDGLSFVQSRTGMNDIYITFFVVLVFYRLYRLIYDYDHAGLASKSVISSQLSVVSSMFTSYLFAGFNKLISRKPTNQNQKTENREPMTEKSFRTLRNLFFLGLASGLAASTKWTGFYAVAMAFVIGVGFVIRKRDWEVLPWSVIFLAGVPPLVYFLSYGQWWLQGHSWAQFVELHKQTWWYQTNLKATHGYQSQALTWPFLYRPVWFYVKYEDIVRNSKTIPYIGNIYTMGHPLIWWAGLVAIGYGVWRFLLGIWQQLDEIGNKIKEQKFPRSGISLRETKIKNNNLLPLIIILVGYFGMFLPWAVSPRIMFLYHYLPSVPFLCLLLAYGLYRIKISGETGRLLVTGFLTLVVLVFIYFYPHWSALPVPTTWANTYYWLPSWK